MKLKQNQIITFRALEKTDKSIVFDWENDPEIWVYSGVTSPYSKTDIAEFVSNPPKLLQDQQERYMVTINNGTVIGCVDLFEFKKEKNEASIGILIDRKFRGLGYAYLALQEIENIAKNAFQIHVLKAKILEENKKSNTVFKKAGYKMSESLSEQYEYQSKQYNLLTYFKKI